MDPQKPAILVAEADPQGRRYFQAAAAEAGLRNPLYLVETVAGLLGHLNPPAAPPLAPPLAPRPGLILLDPFLTARPAQDLVLRLRSNPRTAEIPLLLLTSSAPEGEYLLSLYYPAAAGYLPYPVNAPGLLKALRSAGLEQLL